VDLFEYRLPASFCEDRQAGWIIYAFALLACYCRIVSKQNYLEEEAAKWPHQTGGSGWGALRDDVSSLDIDSK